MTVSSGKSVFTYLVISIAVLLLSLDSAPGDTAVSVNICYEEQQLEPYFMGAGPFPPSRNPGIFIEILQMLSNSRPDIAIDFYRAPWKRCLNEIRAGKADAIIASYSKEREELGMYPKSGDTIDTSLSISSAQYCLFTQKNSPLNWNGVAFNLVPEKPFAVPQGYSIVALLEKHHMPMVLTNSSVSAMDLLTKGRVEAAVTYCEAGAHYLSKNPQEQTSIITQSPALSHREAYLVFSRNFWSEHAPAAKQIWRKAATLRNSEFPRLLDKYEALKSPEQ